MTKQDTIRRLLDRGLTHFGLGQVQEALEAWNEVLSMEPDNQKAKQYIDFVHNNWEPPSNLEEELIRSDKISRPQGIENHRLVRPGETRIGSSSLPSYPSDEQPRHESANAREDIFTHPEETSEVQSPPADEIPTPTSNRPTTYPESEHPPIHSEDFWSIDHPPTNPGQPQPDIWAPLKSEDFQGLSLPPSLEEPLEEPLEVPLETSNAKQDTANPFEPHENLENPEEDIFGITDTPFEKPIMEDDIVTTEAPFDPDSEDHQQTTEAILDMVADSIEPIPVESSRQNQVTESSQSENEIQTWVKGAYELLEMDDFTNSLELAEKILSRDENHAEALSIKSEAESSLMSLLSSKLGDLQRVPVIGMQDDEIIWLNLDDQAGFVLSLIDGQMNLEEIMSVSNLKPLTIMRVLTQLLQDNIIKL